MNAQATLASPRLHVVRVGSFGKAVVKYLKMLHSTFETLDWPDHLADDPTTWPQSEICVLVSWKPLTRLCQAIDDMSFDRKTSFMPVVIDSSWLTLGPIIVPEFGGCWHCWELRLQQHGILNHEKAQLLKTYNDNISYGPRGFPTPVAMIAAARIAEMLDARDGLRSIAGSFWHLNLFTGETSKGTLSGVDGCIRCGLRRPLHERTFRELQGELAFVQSLLNRSLDR